MLTTSRGGDGESEPRQEQEVHFKFTSAENKSPGMRRDPLCGSVIKSSGGPDAEEEAAADRSSQSR